MAAVSPTETATSAAPAVSATPTVVSSGTAPVVAVKTTTGNRLSAPTEVYSVASGDTLFPIGQKYSMTWQRIAQTNGLVEPYTLKIGQQLVIPSINSQSKLLEVFLTPDLAKVQSAESSLSDPKNAWRLDPIATSQVEPAGLFGLKETDDYRLQAKDATKGTATVTATRIVGATTERYDIDLVQPTTKGANGLWAVTAIKERET